MEENATVHEATGMDRVKETLKALQNMSNEQKVTLLPVFENLVRQLNEAKEASDCSSACEKEGQTKPTAGRNRDAITTNRIATQSSNLSSGRDGPSQNEKRLRYVIQIQESASGAAQSRATSKAVSSMREKATPAKVDVPTSGSSKSVAMLAPERVVKAKVLSQKDIQAQLGDLKKRIVETRNENLPAATCDVKKETPTARIVPKEEKVDVAETALPKPNKVALKKQAKSHASKAANPKNSKSKHDKCTKAPIAIASGPEKSASVDAKKSPASRPSSSEGPKSAPQPHQARRAPRY